MVERRIARPGGPGGPPVGPRLDLLQIATAVAAVYLLVIGIVGIARGGFFAEGFTEPVVSVGLISATPALAIALVVVGLLLLWATVGNEIDDLGIRVVAGFVLVLGIVLLIEPGAFQPALGNEPGDGWHHVVLGGVLGILTFVPPIPLRRGPAETTPSRHGRSDPPNDGRTQRIR